MSLRACPAEEYTVLALGANEEAEAISSLFKSRAFLKSKWIPLIHANLREFRNYSRGLAQTPALPGTSRQVQVLADKL